MDLKDFDLPFDTDNAVELTGGSRSRGYWVNGWIVRVPLRGTTLVEQKREAEISALMQKHLPAHLKNKVTSVRFNGKCAYHKEVQGDLLAAYRGVDYYAKMNAKEQMKLSAEIAELLVAIHNIPLVEVRTITQKYAKTCFNENKTVLEDFDYEVAKARIWDVSGGRLDLDAFKITIPTDGLSLCHNDLHSGNIIVKNGILSGFIDFGEAGINPRINDFFHLYRLDRNLAVNVIDEYNKLSDYKIDVGVADYQFLSNTGYMLEQRKDRPAFKPEVAKVLEIFCNNLRK
jgi:aminoglycoside phosphotransferase (APT) family kinase protein